MRYAPHLKRLLDLLIAVLGGLAILPLLAVICILIKVFDPGPVIFRQKRVGKDGVEFDFFKFRSVPVDTAEASSVDVGAVQLTWVGRLLRRSNLDELPQLFNVIKGDMSIVGPRPPILSQAFLLKLRTENGAIRCLPGLTGLAQVSAYDGMSEDEKAEWDGRYAAGITFRTDLSIILRTFVYLFSKPPVY